MTKEEQFDKFSDEYLKFDRIDNPPSQTPEICGLIAIAKLKGGRIDFAAEHDQVWCDTYDKDLTDEEVIYLLRCSILWDEEFEGFYFFT